MKALTLIFFLTLLSGCALTYPGSQGNVTLEFQPTPEMLEKFGLRRTPTLKDK